MDPFEVLNDFEVAIIVENLNCEDIIRLQLVSRRWRGFLNSNFISKVAFLHHFSSCQEVTEYHRLIKEANARALEKKDGEKDKVEAAPKFGFAAAFRKALRRRLNLRNATPLKCSNSQCRCVVWMGDGSKRVRHYEGFLAAANRTILHG